MIALETVSADAEAARFACAPAAVAKLWDVCQVPDYRKISGQNHAELVGTIYKFLMGPDERIPEDWFSKQVAFADRIDGDIDTLANRIAHIRTWTFVSNRADWLKDPEHWQGRTREIEDRLSDALHECLTQRFVDARTSALMKGMRDKTELQAEIAEDGAIHVESHYVGRLQGFRFSPDAGGEGIHGKAARNAAAQVLARELSMRVRRVAAAQADAFQLTKQGRVLWKEEEIAQLEPTDDPLKPSVTILADEHLSAPDREKVQAKLDAWIAQTIAEKLKPLVEIAKAEDISGLARGIAFRMRENLGILKRETVAGEIKALDQTARAQLRKYGVRFGAFNIYFPLLLKPAAAELALTLWSLKQGGANGLAAESMPEPPRAGLTSFTPDPQAPEAFYRAYGYHVCGPRAVRIDILERLADLIRPLLAWRAAANGSAPQPKGATGDGGFTLTPEMMSLLGCSPEELSGVLKGLGFRVERRPLAADRPAEGAAAPAEAPPAGAAAADPSASVPVPETAAVVDAAASAGPASPSVQPELPQAASAPTEAAPAADQTAADVAAAPKEREFEEIWRPRRHARGEHRNKAAATGKPQRRDDKAADRADRGKEPAAVKAAEPAPSAPSGNGYRARPPAPAREARRDDKPDRGPDRGADRSKDAGGRGREFCRATPPDGGRPAPAGRSSQGGGSLRRATAPGGDRGGFALCGPWSPSGCAGKAWQGDQLLTSRAAEDETSAGSQRIDKWLWFARVTKTRTLASELVLSGKVRLNRVRIAKPSQVVRLDDVLTVNVGRRVRLLKVLGTGVRRGPAATACTLYEELTAPADPLKPLAQSSLQIPSWHENDSRPGRREPGSGRPTKKERREIDRLGGKTR